MRHRTVLIAYGGAACQMRELFHFFHHQRREGHSAPKAGRNSLFNPASRRSFKRLKDIAATGIFGPAGYHLRQRCPCPPRSSAFTPGTVPSGGLCTSGADPGRPAQVSRLRCGPVRLRRWWSASVLMVAAATSRRNQPREHRPPSLENPAVFGLRAWGTLARCCGANQSASAPSPEASCIGQFVGKRRRSVDAADGRHWAHGRPAQHHGRSSDCRLAPRPEGA